MRLLPSIIKRCKTNNTVRPYQFTSDFAKVEVSDSSEPQLELNQEQVEDEKILSEALQKAEQILDAARSEGLKIRQEAHDKGYSDGLELGQKEGYVQSFQAHHEAMQDVQKLVEYEMRGLLDDCINHKNQILEEYLEGLKNLSISVAEKVIQVSLKSSGDVIKRMIISATDTLKRTGWAKIYIAKCDAQFLAEGDSMLLKALSHLSDNVKIISMDGEESGTCIIELPEEIIDASVSSQMENIKEILSNARI